MICFGATDKGLVREINQDCFAQCTLSETVLYAVLCDGMGGENGGNVASELAVRGICRELSGALTDCMPDSEVEQLIQNAVAHANTVVHTAAASTKELRGMGTTVVVFVAIGNRAFIAYAGDSRAYLLRGEALSQISHDRTVVQMLIESGEITPDEALVHPQRHYITRAVGVERALETELVRLDLQLEDCVLLCSDGLYNYAAESRLPELMQQALQEGSAQCLIDEANAGGGGDNITAVLIANHRTEDRTDG